VCALGEPFIKELPIMSQRGTYLKDHNKGRTASGVTAKCLRLRFLKKSLADTSLPSFVVDNSTNACVLLLIILAMILCC
jgi:hypothetical protein